MDFSGSVTWDEGENQATWARNGARTKDIRGRPFTDTKNSFCQRNRHESQKGDGQQLTTFHLTEQGVTEHTGRERTDVALRQ
jgi:hypothetical protein